MIKNFTRAVFSATLFFISVKSYTQNDFKSYIPPSPNAQTFQKYTDYPVDYSTGVPSINIPLYTINVKDYSFPISASFHASGRTTAMNFSPLGMNWALNAFGMISREVKGEPDDLKSHPEKDPTYYSPQANHIEELFKLETNFTDTEYDIFTLNINGISAQFIYRDNQEVVFLTYCPYKLEVIKPGGFFENFILTDNQGIIYGFGPDGSGYGFAEFNSSGGFKSSWFINSITTTKGSKLRFLYGSQSTENLSGFIGNFNYTDQVTIGDAASSAPMIANPGDYSTAKVLKRTNSNGKQEFTMGYIKEIFFDEGKVAFTYDNANLLLTECKVINTANSETIRNIGFGFYSTLPGTSLQLPNNSSKTIQHIIFKDATNAQVEKYGFDYYPGISGGNQIDFAKARDYWGYHNGRSTNGIGANYIPVPTILISGASNDPNPPYEQSLGCTGCREAAFEPKFVGMIRRIYYPTGGSSLFEYESNYYNNIYQTPSVKEGPGLRVKRITADDGQGNRIAKIYKYGYNENGIGQIAWLPVPEADYFTLKKKNYLRWNSSNGPVYPKPDKPEPKRFYHHNTILNNGNKSV